MSPPAVLECEPQSLICKGGKCWSRIDCFISEIRFWLFFFWDDIGSDTNINIDINLISIQIVLLESSLCVMYCCSYRQLTGDNLQVNFHVIWVFLKVLQLSERQMKSGKLQFLDSRRHLPTLGWRHPGLQTFNTLRSASASHPQQLRWSSWKPIQKLPLLRLDSATRLLVTQTASAHARTYARTHPHTHTVGGLTQGSPTCILGWGTDSSRVAPAAPTRELSQHTHM